MYRVPYCTSINYVFRRNFCSRTQHFLERQEIKNKVVVSCSLANLLVLLYEHSHRYDTNFLSKNTNKIILMPLQDERGGNISIRTYIIRTFSLMNLQTFPIYFLLLRKNPWRRFFFVSIMIPILPI